MEEIPLTASQPLRGVVGHHVAGGPRAIPIQLRFQLYSAHLVMVVRQYCFQVFNIKASVSNCVVIEMVPIMKTRVMFAPRTTMHKSLEIRWGRVLTLYKEYRQRTTERLVHLYSNWAFLDNHVEEQFSPGDPTGFLKHPVPGWPPKYTQHA